MTQKKKQATSDNNDIKNILEDVQAKLVEEFQRQNQQPDNRVHILEERVDDVEQETRMNKVNT